ncbi:hypothetical protein OEZ86_014582 [Tetradesmus obliquus]|nr:hypothetical protein OEZ86_014582 [Tetradesmus obliquus]
MYVSPPSNHTARQPLAAATRHSSRSGNSLRCLAKGNQKNEGMYFEYVPVDNTKEPSPEERQKQVKKEQQQFGWASAARSSVQQYRKTVSSSRPKPANKPRQQQQQQAAGNGAAAAAAVQQQPAQILQSSAAAAATPTPPPAAAAAAAAAASSSLIDPEGQVLLQELLELAEQLAGPDGYNSVIDSDPLSDPLAGFLGDDEASGFSEFVEPYVEEDQGSAAGLSSSSSSSNVDGFDLSGFDDAEADELFAAVAAMQQRGRSAADALAADDAAAAAAAADGSSSEAGSSRPGSLAAELLAWEASELSKQPQIDIEAAAAAMQRGEVLGGDLEDEDEDEYEVGREDEYELDREDDEDWLEKDPQLKQMMQADGAAFARMLAAVNGDDDEPSSSSSGSATAAAAAAARRGASSRDEVQQEVWSDLGVEDWLEASGSNAAGYGEVHGGAEAEVLSEEDLGLSDLLSQIDADPSLDGEAKMQAKMSIQGVFNDPAAAAGSGSGRKRAGKGSSKARAADDGCCFAFGTQSAPCSASCNNGQHHSQNRRFWLRRIAVRAVIDWTLTTAVLIRPQQAWQAPAVQQQAPNPALPSICPSSNMATAASPAAPTLHTLNTVKDTAQLSPKPRADASNTRDAPMLGQRDTVHIPVPEDEVLQEETVFASSSAQAASIAAGHAARQQQQQRRGGLLALLTCSCLREPSVPEISSDSRSASAVPGGAAAPGGSIGYGASGAASSLGRTASGAAGGASRRQMSRRTSSARKWVSLRRMGSSAYSDAEWFDAASSWGHDDHHAMLAEVESMVKELAPPTGPWVPDPPLSFAVPNMQFIPVPAKLGLAGWWEKDDDRTTPPPLPIDVMLKASWMVQKSHNSVPGVFFEETEKELNMMVKPRFVPPGFPRYQEYYDKTQKEEKTWAPI